MLELELDVGFDILGDGHGCLKTRINLLNKLGYIYEYGFFIHPKGRKIIYLNDEMNKGALKDSRVPLGEFPSVAMTYLMMIQVKNDLAYAVDSNNNQKVIQFLKDEDKKKNCYNDMRFAIEFNRLKIKYGSHFADSLKFELIDFLESLPSHIIIRDKKGRIYAVVSHAGIFNSMIGEKSDEIKKFCAFGGKNKLDWIGEKRDHYVIWGHIPHVKPTIKNKTINIDQGGFCGHYLTGLKVPELEFVQEKVPVNFAFKGKNTISNLLKKRA